MAIQTFYQTINTDKSQCVREVLFYTVQASLLKPTLLEEKFIKFTCLSDFPLVLSSILAFHQTYNFKELMWGVSAALQSFALLLCSLSYFLSLSQSLPNSVQYI